MRAKRASAATEAIRKLAGFAPRTGDPALRPVEAAAAANGVIFTRRHVYATISVRKFTDGDTYWLYLDTGFRQTTLVQIRLFGYDTPEKSKGTPHERAEAKRAAAFTADWITRALADGTLWVRTEPDPDDFGRWLGETWVERLDGTVELLGDALRTQGLASVWPTRWREEFDRTA